MLLKYDIDITESITDYQDILRLDPKYEKDMATQ
jgi:hypothetical protein